MKIILVTDVDAHADSLVDFPEPQAYFSHVTVTNTFTSRQEIVEPRTYAQAIHPSNKFHKEWQFANGKELDSFTQNNTRTFVLMLVDKHIIGCLWIYTTK